MNRGILVLVASGLLLAASSQAARPTTSPTHSTTGSAHVDAGADVPSLLPALIVTPEIATSMGMGVHLVTARTQFQRGVAQFQAQRYADAIALFEASYALVKLPSTVLNLALCLHEVGRIRAARVRLREFLELASGPQKTQYETTVRHLIDTIADRVATLHLTIVGPAQSEVRVDGERITLDASGNVEVDPGTHVISLDAPQYARFRGNFRAENHATVPVTITPTPR